MNFTKENIELIRKFVEIKNRGYYASGAEVTKVYNEVLGKNLPTTNCGSCIRQRIGELENALNQFKSISDSKNEEKPLEKPKKARKKEE